MGRGAPVKLRAADDERRQTKRHNLSDMLTAEAKSLADLKVEKAAVRASVAPSRPILVR